MVLAHWDAVVQAVGRGAVGSAVDFARRPNRPSVVLFACEPTRGASRIHQEDAHDSKVGFAAGKEAEKGDRAMSKRHIGSSLDAYLKEEGIFEEMQAKAIKEVVAWQLAQAMKKRKISKLRMALLLKTSRTQVDRLLNPKSDITLSSLQRAAAIVGRRVSIELV
jgi:antitoxin HicB